MLILLLGCILAFALNLQPTRSEPTTIVVPDDYPTIQGAINKAREGDTVFVRGGTYRENVVLNKSLSLIGEGEEATVIDGNGTGNVITIAANYTRISRFRIQNSGSDPVELYGGIQAINSTGSKINDNIVTGNGGFGIVLEHSDNNILLGNMVVNNAEMGIYLEYSSHNALFYNNVSTNRREGIRLFNSRSNKIASNNITDNGSGIWLDLSSNNNILSNILADNHKVGIWLASSSNNSIITNSVAGSRFDGIDLTFLSNNNDIIGNTIEGNSRGIVLFFARDNGPSGNNIYHNNFINNQDQAYVNVPFGNSWDDGYPSGGNYWSDYNGTDFYGGPNQNQLGCDGIGDTPYVVYDDHLDMYPLMNPWPRELPPPLLRVEPVVFNASRVGEVFDINITMNNLQEEWHLAGVFFKLGFDPELLEPLEVTPGDFMHPPIGVPPIGAPQTLSGVEEDHVWTVFFIWPNETGELPYVPQGTGNLATITFKVKEHPPTSSIFFLYDILLSDQSWDQIPHIAEWGHYHHTITIDVALVSVEAFPTQTYMGWAVIVNVAAKNNGTNFPTFGVTVYYNDTAAGRKIVNELPPGRETTISFSFDTSNLTLYLNYTITSEADVLEGEANTLDNTITMTVPVKIKMPGDLDGDRKIDIRDISMAALAFGSYPEHPEWNPQADINQDDRADIRDLTFIAKNFGKTYP